MLNKYKKIVNIVVWCSSIYFLKKYIEASKQLLNKTKRSKLKFEGYYNVENEWLRKKISGETLEKFFEKNDYKTVAIYGNGNLGKLLCDDLFESNIDIKYIIDNNGGNYREIKVVDKNSELEDVDVIVVTPTFDFENIKEDLRFKTDCKVASLFDVVWYE